MQIALLVPSRERTKNKLELVESIQQTVDDINNVVLYFGIDTDDPERNNAYLISERNPFVKIVDIPSVGKFQNLGVLWNICAKEAKEDILAMIGDDMVFVTKGWDTKILKEFALPDCPADNFKMVYCYDGRHGAKIAVNAFLHRRYMELTGYFMREEFPVDKVDIWLQQIFTAFGRIKYRGDIHIEHRHWSFRKSVVDSTVLRMRANDAENISNDMWVNTLQERLNEANKISSILSIPYNKSIINNKLP